MFIRFKNPASLKEQLIYLAPRYALQSWIVPNDHLQFHCTNARDQHLLQCREVNKNPRAPFVRSSQAVCILQIDGL